MPRLSSQRTRKKAKTARGRGKPRRAVGRPEKYTPDVLDKLAQQLLRWFSRQTNWWLKDFAFQHGMHWTQLTELAEKSEAFSNALKMAKDMQEAKLFRLGLSKRRNASMAIFALKNVAGWRDKQEIEHTGGMRLNVSESKTKDIYAELANLLSSQLNGDLEALLKGTGVAKAGRETPGAESHPGG